MKRLSKLFRVLFSSDPQVRTGRELARLLQRIGIPLNRSRPLVKTLKIICHPISYARHRYLGARQTYAHQPCSGKYLTTNGFLFFDVADVIPNAQPVLELLRTFYEERSVGAGLDRKTMIWQDRPESSRTYPTLRNCFRKDDLINHPEIADFLLDDYFISLAVAEIGSLPKISGVTLAWSLKNDLLESSQLFHLDLEDNKQIKFFINLSEVGCQNGPLTFLSATDSMRVVSNSAGIAPGEHVGPSQRVPDAIVDEVCPPDHVQRLIGPSGTGLALNTGRCLHYGSRCQTNDRVMLMFQFVPENVFREPSSFGPLFPKKRYQSCRIRSAVLA